MSCMEIEWLTTEDLISELMRRETFLGVIIRPTNEVVDCEPHDLFTISIKGMDAEGAHSLLQKAIDAVQ